MVSSPSWSKNLERTLLKSVNLQYNMLVCGPIWQMTRRPSVWCSKYYLFFIKSCNILYKKPFNLFSNFFCKITKMKIKSFECPKSYKKIWKKKYLERQMLGQRVVCPKSPANQRIILYIVGFLVVSYIYWPSWEYCHLL